MASLSVNGENNEKNRVRELLETIEASGNATSSFSQAPLSSSLDNCDENDIIIATENVIPGTDAVDSSEENGLSATDTAVVESFLDAVPARLQSQESRRKYWATRLFVRSLIC